MTFFLNHVFSMVCQVFFSMVFVLNHFSIVCKQVKVIVAHLLRVLKWMPLLSVAAVFWELALASSRLPKRSTLLCGLGRSVRISALAQDSWNLLTSRIRPSKSHREVSGPTSVARKVRDQLPLGLLRHCAVQPWLAPTFTPQVCTCTVYDWH